MKSHMRLQDVGLPDKHRFPMRKYRMTREALQADSSIQDMIEAREVIVPSTDLRVSHACMRMPIPVPLKMLLTTPDDSSSGAAS